MTIVTPQPDAPGLHNNLTSVWQIGTGYTLAVNAGFAHSGTQFSSVGDGVLLTFIGTGFQFSGDNPIEGTITSINVIGDDLSVIATWTSFPPVDVDVLIQAISNPDHNPHGAGDQAFAALFFGGADTITGTGPGHNDEISGFAGDDVIAPRGGGDIVDGGDGFDTLQVFGASTDLSTTLFSQFEVLSFAKKSNESAIAVNFIGSQIGESVPLEWRISGSAAADTLRIDAISGAVSFADWLFVSWNSAVDLIDLRGNDGNDDIIGTTMRDTIDGGLGNDDLSGVAGNDILNGGAGADILNGGIGDDTYYVDNLFDVTSEAVDAGVDTVVASRSWAVASNIERVILSGSGDFNVAGNGLANNLKGNSGDNWLNGSFGKDTLTGGGGRDSFIFNRTLGANNIDTITDYDVVRDVMRIDNAVFAGIGPAGALAAGAYQAGAAATQADDRIIYDAATGKLFFDIDGVGGAAQQHFATLANKPAALSAAEFIII